MLVLIAEGAHHGCFDQGHSFLPLRRVIFRIRKIRGLLGELYLQYSVFVSSAQTSQPAHAGFIAQQSISDSKTQYLVFVYHLCRYENTIHSQNSHNLFRPPRA